MDARTPCNPVIAVVANRYTDFRRPVIEHVGRLLAEAGYGLLCVLGKELQATDSSSTSTLTTCNGIYTAAADFNVQGFLVISVTLGYTTLPERVHQLIQGYKHKPVVSFGLAVPGIPSITIENERAMHDLMEHMTSDPRRKRFVFIRGYPNMPDSIQREAIFRSEMSKKGLYVDEKLIITGNFLTADSFQAVEALLDQTTDFDAIVAASDIMAISAIQALNKQGIRVPDDVIVSGFDDRPVASDSIPPLTTVRYSFEDNATTAVHSLLKLIDSSYKTDSSTSLACLESQLVLRESSQPVAQNCTQSKLGHTAHTTSELKALLSADLTKNLTTVKCPDNLVVENLIASLVGLLFDNSDKYRQVVDAQLKMVHETPDDKRWWRHASYQLEKTFRSFDLSGNHSNAQKSLASLLIQIQSTLWTVQEKQQFDTLKYLQLQDTLHIDLASCSSVAGIFSVLDDVFVQLDVIRAFIVLYDSPSRIPDERARLRFTFQKRQGEQLDIPFDSPAVLPELMQQELSQGLLVLSPLCRGTTNFGYLLIDPSNIRPLNIENLANCIGNTLCSCDRLNVLQKQARELHSTNIELDYLANYDTLTGLCNRTRFNHILKDSFTKYQSNNELLSVLFLDLDGFKMVNDTLGHNVGDDLLKIVGARLIKILRAGETVARLGGDEFAVAASAKSVENIVERLLEAMREPFTLGVHKVNLTVSIGAATYPKDGNSVNELLKNADTAMYHAKDAGKNRFSIYDARMNEEAHVRILIDQAMRVGLENNEFTMHFQPRVDASNGNVVAFEALMRWFPENSDFPASYTMPDIFIALAEKTGFITQLDTFALEQACAQLGRWHSLGYCVRMSVNMSIAQLQQSSIVALVQRCLSQYDVDPEYLELEITEYAAMTNITDNVNTLSALQRLGVHISIDDFGTGYSSLNYLKQLPVSCLKIDRSFLKDIDSVESYDSADGAIVKTIVALGKSMNYRIIAEGVETSVQRNFLEALGCHECQGYLYSPPLERSLAEQYLANSYRPIKQRA